jgi:N-acetylglucosamine malate deacetylase 1
VSEKLEILVVAPHPDDAELGMGGAIAKLIRAGKRLGILDLTSGEPTPYGTPAIRAAETAVASKALGVSWRRNLELPNRRLEASLEARAKLAEVFRETQPEWIFAPYWVDAHPDHLAAIEMVEASRFWSKLTKTTMAGEPFHPKRIFNYYCVHLKMHAQPAFVLDITDTWPAKLESIRAFQSQFVTGRDSSFIEQLEIDARYWGGSIGVRYGEPFTCREPIGLLDLNPLI